MQNPTEWFDQFPSAPENWTHTQWCWRHWAPCPILGANGIGATIEVQKTWLEELKPPELNSSDVEALNTALAATGRICCTLGDDRMYEIWGHWPPAEEKNVQANES